MCYIVVCIDLFKSRALNVYNAGFWEFFGNFGDWLQFLGYYVRKSWIFVNGDSSTNRGKLFEALNPIVCWDLPAIVVCQNNPCKFAFDLLFICMV